MNKKLFILIFYSVFGVLGHAQVINTIAGDGISGYCCDDSLATNAELFLPNDVAIDNLNNIYITDGYNNRIRKISTSGIITSIAGTGIAGYNGDNMIATNANINFPTALTVDIYGNIYFCDDHNYRIRMINTLGIITTIAGTGFSGYSGDYGPATLAQITTSVGIAIDKVGQIYIGDISNNRIRKISSANGGIISTLAGTGVQGYIGDGGPATLAELYYPTGVTIDSAGNVFFAEHQNNCIRKINKAGIINTLAGTGISGFSGDNGPATLAQLAWPNGLKVDDFGNIYFTDVYNDRIRKINNLGIISTVAGTGTGIGTGGFSGDGGPAFVAELNTPTGIAINSTVDIFIADAANNRIRYIRNDVLVPSGLKPIQKLEIYPNPATLSVYFTFPVSAETKIKITDVTGRVMEQQTKCNVTNTSFNVSGYTPDIYMYQVINNSITQTGKIIVGK